MVSKKSARQNNAPAPSNTRAVDDYFATINLRSKTVVRVILHKGAKVKDNSTAGLQISDPEKLLEWPARDRAVAQFSDMADVTAKRAAFEKIVKQWVEQL